MLIGQCMEVRLAPLTARAKCGRKLVFDVEPRDSRVSTHLQKQLALPFDISERS